MFKFWGKVRQGQNRGKILGFPTANINLKTKIAEGIYISKVKSDRMEYPALTFIGTAKTFNETKFHAENYILDFKKNLYDQWITVTLLKRIRGNKKFKLVKELVLQMKKDESMAREYFKIA